MPLPDMDALLPIIDQARQGFARVIAGALAHGPLSSEHYARFLTMQYHLTRGVQRYFFAVAAHPSLSRRKPLRSFLVNFANEEELHFQVAASDLAEMGLEPGPCPLDVELWHALFEKHTPTHPFSRLGAAAVLENMSSGEAKALVAAALSAPFLTKQNTKFVTIHRHETLPHGDQVLDALRAAQPDEAETKDLLWGASAASVMYLRMARWAVNPEDGITEADVHCDESALVDRSMPIRGGV